MAQLEIKGRKCARMLALITSAGVQGDDLSTIAAF